jgi:type I restriction enzyme S subunit
MMKIDKVTDIETDEIPYELPKGWIWTKLEDIIEKISNGITERQEKENVGLPVTRIETISNGYINLDRIGYLSNLSSEVVEKFRLLQGDILFSHINSDSHLGKTAIFNLNNFLLLHGMNLLLIRTNKRIAEPNFLNYLCNHYRFSGIFISMAQHAVNQSSINQSKLRNLEIALPPLSEQSRIVAKIEEIFTKLDAGIESLKKVQAQLKRYRQAVLKYAVEGKLTAEWRAIHKDELEPASVLLERIRKEKNKDSKYADSLIDDKQDMMADLPDLPDGWVWTKLREICDLNPRFADINLIDDSEVTFLPMKNVEEKTGRFDLSLTKKLSEVRKGYTPFIDDDIIFAKITPCMENGKIAIVHDLKNGVGFGSTEFHVIRLYKPLINKYIFYFLLQDGLRKDAQRKMTGSAGQLRVPAEYMRQVLIPLPYLIEQQKITEEIEDRLSIADKVEFIINAEIKRAERLRQSILKQAFSGKLVPQDPNDEPASVLLERIKHEKAKNDNQIKGQKSNDNTEQMKLL